MTDRFIPSNVTLSNFYLTLSTLTILDSFNHPEEFANLPEKEKDEAVVQFEHEAAIARALGLPSIPSKVMEFSNSYIFKLPRDFLYLNLPLRENHQIIRHESVNSAYSKKRLGKLFTDYSRSYPRKRDTAEIFLPDKVLDAPDILNDFYSNLVSWSSSQNLISAALKNTVYIWSESSGPQNLNLPISPSLISCIAFNNKNILAISQRDGSLTFYDVSRRRLVVKYHHPSNYICCMTWKLDSDHEIYVGDRNGIVTHLVLKLADTYTTNDSGFNYSVYGRATLRGHNEQICGIEFSPDSKQVAIGGNDNSVTIWDITDPSHPKLEFILPHKAAVKALAFCPWAPSLLATGGGSHDRTINFWYTRSGGLLESHEVKAQVTALIWSKTYSQIAVTFGFGHTPAIVSVYSYPRCRLLRQSLKASNTRALGAVASPDRSTVCLASSDQSLRFYKLWVPVRLKVPADPIAGISSVNSLNNGGQRKWRKVDHRGGSEGRGWDVALREPPSISPVFLDRSLFGSDIIDMVEGVDFSTIIIR